MAESNRAPHPDAPSEAPLPSIEAFLADRSASTWFHEALRGALSRDPVDAANDSEILTRLLDRRAQEAIVKAQADLRASRFRGDGNP